MMNWADFPNCEAKKHSLGDFWCSKQWKIPTQVDDVPFKEREDFTAPIDGVPS